MIVHDLKQVWLFDSMPQLEKLFQMGNRDSHIIKCPIDLR